METGRGRGVEVYSSPPPPSAPRNTHSRQRAGAGRVNYDPLTLQTLSLSKIKCMLFMTVGGHND